MTGAFENPKLPSAGHPKFSNDPGESSPGTGCRKAKGLPFAVPTPFRPAQSLPRRPPARRAPSPNLLRSAGKSARPRIKRQRFPATTTIPELAALFPFADFAGKLFLDFFRAAAVAMRPTVRRAPAARPPGTPRRNYYRD